MVYTFRGRDTDDEMGGGLWGMIGRGSQWDAEGEGRMTVR